MDGPHWRRFLPPQSRLAAQTFTTAVTDTASSSSAPTGHIARSDGGVPDGNLIRSRASFFIGKHLSSTNSRVNVIDAKVAAGSGMICSGNRSCYTDQLRRLNLSR
jgi:hypothetical protein